MNSTGFLARPSQLPSARLDEMFALMDSHYDGMSRTVFDDDLREKQWVILVEDSLSGRLAGFSSLMVISVEVEGVTHRAVFSGDTIINKDAWGQQQLFQVSGWFLRTLMEACPDESLYWFLITKGYKTYRFLPVFFQEFYPRFDCPTPLNIQQLIDALGRVVGGANFDGRHGIIRACETSYRLRPGMAEIEPSRLNDPHVQYFVSRNPAHLQGDELCCVAPLHLDNFTRVAFRAMGPRPPQSVLEQASEFAAAFAP